MALVLKTDGTGEIIFDASNKILQDKVDGYYEMLEIPAFPTEDTKVAYMVINDEGKLRGLPVNTVATNIIRDAGYAGTIVGDAVLCFHGEID